MSDTPTTAEPVSAILIKQLTPAEFHRAVLATAPQAAVFDCDGTLWSGDAGYEFMVWSIESGLVSPGQARWMEAQYALYRAGERSELATCGDMVQLYAGLPEDEIRHAAKHFVQEYVTPRIFPEMKALVADLHAAGCAVWAVSSTNHWVIEEGVRAFGIPPHRNLAARVQAVDGMVTSHLLDVPTDEGKAAALRRAGLPTPSCVFGNSIHDAAMLALARHPFAVNPTTALLETAAEQGWPVFYPAAIARTGVL